MNKNLWKKALTAVMTVALVLTSSGIQSIALAKDISVVSVYANIEKATLAVGETKQLTTYTVPANASNQDMEFSSSNDKIATVSDKGLVTAVAPGTAKIKVKATDGSGEYETVKITVAGNLKITKKSVDSDNEVVVLDKTYGSVTISKSVGNATIYLSNVKIKNTLTMEDGKYKVYMYGSTAKKVNVDKAKSGDKIASLAVTDYKYDVPGLEVKAKSKIEEILASLGIMFGQDQTSNVANISFIQKYYGQLNAEVTGFTGNLKVFALGDGQVDAKLVNSKVAIATISGDASGKVNLTSEGTSSVGTLTLAKQADLGLSVPTDNLVIDKGAKASLTASSKIGTLTNEGSGTQLIIGSTVDKLLSTGDSAKITVKSEGVVSDAILSGKGSSVAGKGTVKAVSVQADNCAVDTEQTQVKVGNVSGTVVQGKGVSGGQTATTAVVPVATGGTSSGSTDTPTTTPTPTTTVTPTKTPSGPTENTLFSANYNDGSDPITTACWDNPTANTALHNGGSRTVKTGNAGYKSDGALLIDADSDSTDKYPGVRGIGYHFANAGTYRIKAWIKNVNDKEQQVQLQNTADYSSIKTFTVKQSDWTLIDYTFTLDKGTTVLLDTPTDGTYDYYVDDFTVYEEISGDATPTPSVEPTKTPTVAPTTAPANKPIVKADFEDGTLGGLNGDLAKGLSIENGGYNGSAKCLKVDTASVGWGTPGLNLLQYKGKTITIIAYMKNDSAPGQKIDACIQLKKDGDKDASYPQTSLDASSGWTKFELEQAIPADATTANMYFEQSYQQKVPNFCMDNVLIFDGAKAEAEAEYSKLFGTPVTPPESTSYTANFEDGKNPFTNYYKNATSGPINNGDGVYAVTGSAIEVSGSAVVVSGSALEATGAALSAKLKNNYDGIGYKFDKDGIYKISAWVKGNDATPCKVRFYDPDTYATYGTKTIDNTKWYKMEYYLPIKAGKTLMLAPNYDASNLNILIDAFNVTKVSTTVIDDSSKEYYGFTINGTPVSIIEVNNVKNVVAVSGSSITANTYKCASIGLGSEYAGKTILVSAKVRSTTGGNLAINVNTASGTVNAAVQYGASPNTWYTIQGCATVNGAGELCIATDNDKDIANTTYYFADVVVQVVNP